MITATLLALGAACLHTGWNLAVKSSTGDRYAMLWGQFVLGGALSVVVVFALGGVSAHAWGWAFLSGVVHVPYTIFLARAYDRGDFSHAYPIARGSGALGAAIGGVIVLGDSFTTGALLAIATVVTGLVVIAGRAARPASTAALAVGGAIACYTLLDSRGARVADVAHYGFASGAASGLTVGVTGLVTMGRRSAAASIARYWRPMLLGGIAQKLAYALVLAAVRLAQVGYVAALRESSVVLAVLVGWVVIGEEQGRRRLVGASVVVVGLIGLVVAG